MLTPSLPNSKQPGVPEAIIHRVGLLTCLSRSEQDRLSLLLGHKHTFEAPSEPLIQGEGARRAMLVEEGWCYRYKLLSDGRRQLLGLALPGDMIGLRCGLFGIDDHSVVALSTVRVAWFPIAELVDLFAELPRVAAAFSAISAREEAILSQQVIRLGRMDAYERTAHLFLEIHHRLRAVGCGDENGFAMPLTQELLADMLGITVVHVNRTLRRLRQSGLVTIEHGKVTFRDIDGLIDVCEFDPHYLEPSISPGTRSRLVALDPNRQRRGA